MAGVLDGVDQRTRLAGENRMELLLFYLDTPQMFGINVFKVQEVIRCPGMTKVANSDPIVSGITNIRGRTIPVLDLAMAIGRKPIEDMSKSYVIVTEFNRSVQGFLVGGVNRIINIKWADIQPPPRGLGKDNFMTAVTKIDDTLVEIIDVEKVLEKFRHVPITLEEGTTIVNKSDRPLCVAVIDDSSVARNQIKRTLENVGIEIVLARDGKEGLDMLKKMAEGCKSLTEKVDLVISDVEMPEMDGYTLTMNIRKDEVLKNVPVILHTSLSGQFNSKMVEQVGADSFIPKFSAQQLVDEVNKILSK